MIISEKNKYIYVANPKTGSTSIQSFLLEIDDSARKNSIELNGNKYRFREHFTASQIRMVLGEKFDNYIVFGFVRYPLSKRVSAYHFLKANRLMNPGTKRLGKRITDSIKAMSCRIMPFRLWSMVYPYRSNMMYFKDNNGELIAHKIGRFENLPNDLYRILNELWVDRKGKELPKKNQSRHKNYEYYFRESVSGRLSMRKLKEDLIFYDQLNNRLDLSLKPL